MLSSVTHARTRPASCKATSGLTILIHVEGQSRGRIATTRGGKAGMGENSRLFGSMERPGRENHFRPQYNPSWPANQLELDAIAKMTYFRGRPGTRQKQFDSRCRVPACAIWSMNAYGAAGCPRDPANRLPAGLSVVRVLRLRGGIPATLVLAFALSLVANHALVAGLVVLGIYRPAIVYAVFAVETAVFLGMERRSLQTSCDRCLPVSLRRLHRRAAALAFAAMLLAAATLVIAGFALAGLAQIGQIFQQWDAVVSWNRWAIDWAANRLPAGTSLYPQLLPANVSLTYVFMQTSEIWIFAKAFQFLFCLMLLLAMFDAARATGNFGFVPGVLITYGLLVAVLRFRMIGSGYADVPLAFFSFAAVYALLLARHAEAADTAAIRNGRRGAGRRGGTDQADRPVYRAALSAAGMVARLAERRRGSGCGGNAGTLLRVALLTGALVAPWYLHKFAEFHAARDGNNTARLLRRFPRGPKSAAATAPRRGDARRRDHARVGPHSCSWRSAAGFAIRSSAGSWGSWSRRWG